VISSPIHMITAVPDTIVTTMVRMVSGVGCGISGWDAGRNRAIMAPVNSSFLRRSGVRNARANTLGTAVALE
jgi:hypothetical protein